MSALAATQGEYNGRGRRPPSTRTADIVSHKGDNPNRHRKASAWLNFRIVTPTNFRPQPKSYTAPAPSDHAQSRAHLHPTHTRPDHRHPARAHARPDHRHPARARSTSAGSADARPANARLTHLSSGA